MRACVRACVCDVHVPSLSTFPLFIYPFFNRVKQKEDSNKRINESSKDEEMKSKGLYNN